MAVPDGGGVPADAGAGPDRSRAELRAAALALLDAVRDDPAAAALAARHLRTRALDDPEALSLVERVLAVAASSLGDPVAAAGHAHAALELASVAGLDQRAAEARMTLALPLLALGHGQDALAAADAAVEALPGVPRARAEAQRGLVLQRLGRTEDALATFRRALPVLRRAGDDGWETILRTNRGVLHIYRRDWHAAKADLERAATLAERSGERHALAFAEHNLGFLDAWRGDLPRALARYDTADAVLAQLGMFRGSLQVDRAEALLAAGLAEEARAAAEQAVEALRSRRMETDAAEARLTLAQAALAAGDHEQARTEAGRARSAFLDQRRPSWEALARYVALRGRWQAGPHSAALARQAAALADTLDDAGWPVPAADARLVAARVALRLGQAAQAERLLERCSGARLRGPAALRAHAWYAEALRRDQAGDRRGAYLAAHAGLRVLDRNEAALGASELRAHVAGFAGELARFGLRLALLDGRAAQVFAWSERGRARALRRRPVRPPEDGTLADELTALRAAAMEVEEATLAGADTTAARRKLARAEERVRRRARHAPGDDRHTAPPPRVRDLAERLGDAALVSYVELDGRLHALVLAGGRPRLRALGPAAEAARELDALRFALRRLAHRHGSAASLDAAESAAAHASRRLDAQLLAPLADLLGDRPLVLVPTGRLHAMPWSLLAGCAGRPLSVAPSAASWLRAARAQPSGAATVLVAASEPGHAAAEVRALEACYPDAAALHGAQATAAEVTAALDGAALAHVACHGRFRADNPQFSHLRLEDGPLTVYDLEGLRRPPHRLVLSACDSGLSGVAAGEELMGLAGSLLALGSGALVASVVPVADDATRRLMVDFHGRLAAGAGPAEALAAAQSAARASTDDGHLAAAAGFVCFGAG